MTAPALTWPKVMAWRVAKHHLDARVPRTGLLDVVARIGGLHAQLMSSAELTAWARVDQLEPDGVANALWEDRSLVKTWAMRGTLHLLPSADYGLWQAGLSTYRHFLKPAWSKAFGLTPDDLDRLGEAICAALDGRQLTREELAAEVVKQSGDESLGAKMTGSWGSTIKPAAFRGQLCFGPNRGRNVTFARPDQWIGAWKTVDPEEAMTELSAAVPRHQRPGYQGGGRPLVGHHAGDGHPLPQAPGRRGGRRRRRRHRGVDADRRGGQGGRRPSRARR